MCTAVLTRDEICFLIGGLSAIVSGWLNVWDRLRPVGGLISFYSTLGISSIRISSNKTAEIWRCRPAGPVTNSMRQTR